ncbi:hypothetical protein [Lactobacillus crispatus]|uniref:DUF624 domain-containing protein n=1 Tax=Lactobacillus crispatus TaxID=47770 RepID=A0A6P1TVM7_9LACO|nr:hypothetical protein [Lactobacillus crispatus]QHQ67709.1 hypothetical protein GSR61_03545 [Lactobacillus crispatus]HJF09580.1 hypothetical protein [Lactobacillus crispatus]
MRSKVIKAVEYFYMCVMMSIKFWWLIIRNFVICGIAAGIHGAMAYFASPKEEKDLHQKINSDVHFNLINVQFLSAATMLLLSLCWTAGLLLKRTSPSMVLSAAFWILAIWSVLVLTFLTILGIVTSVDKFNDDKKYYLRSVVLFIRCPQLTLTTMVLWVVTGLLIVKQPVIGVLVMPGLLMAIINNMYKKLGDHQLLPD